MYVYIYIYFNILVTNQSDSGLKGTSDIDLV